MDKEAQAVAADTEQVIPLPMPFRVGFDKLPLEELVAKAGSILNRLGEDGTGYKTYSVRQQFRDHLHELSHHVMLSSVQGSPLHKKRRMLLVDEIDLLGPAASDGNEIDALAVELEVAAWLGYPYSLRDVALPDFLALSDREVKRAVRIVRQRVKMTIALRLAKAVYDEPVKPAKQRSKRKRA